MKNKKNRKPTMGYYEIGTPSSSYEEVLREALKIGYKYIFRWINSDDSWTFFQTTYDKAEKAAIDLYIAERGGRFIGMDAVEAKKYYAEYIDIMEVKEELNNV